MGHLSTLRCIEHTGAQKSFDTLARLAQLEDKFNSKEEVTSRLDIAIEKSSSILGFRSVLVLKEDGYLTAGGVFGICQSIFSSTSIEGRITALAERTFSLLNFGFRNYTKEQRLSKDKPAYGEWADIGRVLSKQPDCGIKLIHLLSLFRNPNPPKELQERSVDDLCRNVYSLLGNAAADHLNIHIKDDLHSYYLVYEDRHVKRFNKSAEMSRLWSSVKQVIENGAPNRLDERDLEATLVDLYAFDALDPDLCYDFTLSFLHIINSQTAHQKILSLYKFYEWSNHSSRIHILKLISAAGEWYRAYYKANIHKERSKLSKLLFNPELYQVENQEITEITESESSDRDSCSRSFSLSPGTSSDNEDESLASKDSSSEPEEQIVEWLPDGPFVFADNYTLIKELVVGQRASENPKILSIANSGMWLSYEPSMIRAIEWKINWLQGSQSPKITKGLNAVARLFQEGLEKNLMPDPDALLRLNWSIDSEERIIKINPLIWEKLSILKLERVITNLCCLEESNTQNTCLGSVIAYSRQKDDIRMNAAKYQELIEKSGLLQDKGYIDHVQLLAEMIRDQSAYNEKCRKYDITEKAYKDWYLSNHYIVQGFNDHIRSTASKITNKEQRISFLKDAANQAYQQVIDGKSLWLDQESLVCLAESISQKQKLSPSSLPVAKGMQTHKKVIFIYQPDGKKL
jgi:hypothetical protein